MLAFFWLVFALIGFLSASPLQSVKKRAPSVNPVFIAYRSVPPGDAKLYQDNGNTLTAQSPNTMSSNQIGPGVYVSDVPGDWPGQWYCAIIANQDSWNAVNKAWIPEEFGTCGKPLWGMSRGVPNIPEYLQTLDPSWTPQNTILISYINGYQPGSPNGIKYGTKIQFLIPNSFLSPAGYNPLGISVSCVEGSTPAGASFLTDFPTINWRAFQNLKGNFPQA